MTIAILFIDTVHERNLDTDILLALLKQTLPSVPRIRVILMSATLDADRFAAYWGKATPRIRTFILEAILSILWVAPH
jgi:HrpA-like RNA helicase